MAHLAVVYQMKKTLLHTGKSKAKFLSIFSMQHFLFSTMKIDGKTEERKSMCVAQSFTRNHMRNKILPAHALKRKRPKNKHVHGLIQITLYS